MTWVKICGITREEDLLQAAQAGADAVGLVLAPSKRRLTPERMAQLALQVPPRLTAVAVLTEIAPALVAAIRKAGIRVVQVHGPEEPTPEELALLAGLRLIRATPAGRQDSPEPAWVWRWLVDSPPGEHAGGTGATCDWVLAAEAVARRRRPVILAGGLTPRNVAGAIRQVRPWGVDVSTGVEAAPGCKDPARVTEFIRRVRETEVTG